MEVLPGWLADAVVACSLSASSRWHRRMRKELDELRRDREREDRDNQAIAEQAEEAQSARIEAKALGGSRFNVHFGARPSVVALTPESLIRAQEEYVDFDDPGYASEFDSDPGAPSARSANVSATQTARRGFVSGGFLSWSPRGSTATSRRFHEMRRRVRQAPPASFFVDSGVVAKNF